MIDQPIAAYFCCHSFPPPRCPTIDSIPWTTRRLGQSFKQIVGTKQFDLNPLMESSLLGFHVVLITDDKEIYYKAMGVAHASMLYNDLNNEKILEQYGEGI